MFLYADAVISVFSTTAIEAAIFDKPTIVIGFDGYQKRPKHQSITRLEDLAHFRHILETDAVVIARSFNELKSNIEDALLNPGRKHEARRNLVDKMCYKMDGKAAERIVSALLENYQVGLRSLSNFDNIYHIV
jgi:CDP-glycerol glycerophosphotransferase (TagB/SpsB family)